MTKTTSMNYAAVFFLFTSIDQSIFVYLSLKGHSRILVYKNTSNYG